jgi:DNA segregation ATPase FtsK/SpoIIIE, S-DNA-T family
VVLIDEFATMAVDLPDFIQSLVSIAQRGRSLGVHLILATQRPAGAVNDSIRANMNLRISLRVQSPSDSVDVLGVPDAAYLARRSPGRALVRTGPSELTAVQTASSTLTLRSEVVGQHHRPRCIEDIPSPPIDPAGSSSVGDDQTDLTRVVKTAIATSRIRGDVAPRRPWPEPLPDSITLTALVATGLHHGDDPGSAPVMLADLPDEQRQRAQSIDIFATNVAFIGSARSGTNEALTATLCTLTYSRSPNDLHLYLLDYGAQTMSPLGCLPHVGAVITPGEPSRFHRLVRHLTRTLDQRRTIASDGQSIEDEPHLVLAIDNWTAVRAAFDDLTGGAVLDDLMRVIADGPAFKITTLLTAERPTSMPAAMSSSFGSRYAFHFVDPMDDSMLGIGRGAPTRKCPGRAIDVRTLTEIQFAIADNTNDLIQRTMQQWSTREAVGVRRRPAPILLLPSVVAFQAPPPSVTSLQLVEHDRFSVRFALGDNDLEPIGWDLAEGEHGVISGPAGSGKTTALAAVAVSAAALDPTITIHVICGRKHRLGQLIEAHVHDTPAEASEAIERSASGQRHLMLIDDAEFIDDGGDLAALLAQRRSGLWMVASARPEVLRSSYGHFTATMRKSRQGFALRPQRDIDGELWATPLPRRRTQDEVFPAGRGFLIRDGVTELAHVMVSLDQRWLDAALSRRMVV